MAKKRVLIIIAPLDFNDQVATTLRSHLEESGFQAEIGSTMTGTARGVNGTQIPITIDLKDMVTADFEGAALVGGPGFVSYFSGYRLLRGKLDEMNNSGKLLVGTGEAMLLLARVGLLNGKKIASPPDEGTASTLRKEGASITNEKIVLDGSILTASTDAPPRDLANRVVTSLLATD